MMTRKAITIGQALRMYVTLRNTTQKDLALSIGMSPQFMSDIIRGKKQLPAEWLSRMPPDLQLALLPIEIERSQRQIKWLRSLLRDAQLAVKKT